MRKHTLAAAGLVLAAVVSVSACSGGSGGTPSSPVNPATGLAQLPVDKAGCASSFDVLRAPNGQEYVNGIVNVDLQAPDKPCKGTVIKLDRQGRLTYSPGSTPGESDTVPLQPLVLDTSERSTIDLFLTQNLRRQLRPGDVRYVDTAAVEADSGGTHVLAGFPTAAKRFHAYYASLAVIGGKVQVCLPAGKNNDQGLHGGGDDHAETFVRVEVRHDGEGCELHDVVEPLPTVNVTGIPLHGTGFGECADLARGPEGEYFDLDGTYNLQVGMPGYDQWPLHVKITHSAPDVYKVVVIDEESCRDFEHSILPIRKTA